MEWKIGIVPQQVWKDARIPAQAMRDAKVANLVGEQAEQAQAEAVRKGADVAPPPPDPIPAPAESRAQPGPFTSRPLTEAEKSYLSLSRLLDAVLQRWRRCPARACRRHHACASPARECESLPARKTRTPAQEAAALAHLQRAIKRRLNEFGGTS